MGVSFGITSVIIIIYVKWHSRLNWWGLLWNCQNWQMWQIKVRYIWNEMAYLLKSEGWNRIELFQTTTILLVSCSKPGERGAISFWKVKCISCTLLLTNIACLIIVISLYGLGHFEMEFDLVLSISLMLLLDCWGPL